MPRMWPLQPIHVRSALRVTYRKDSKGRAVVHFTNYWWQQIEIVGVILRLQSSGYEDSQTITMSPPLALKAETGTEIEIAIDLGELAKLDEIAVKITQVSIRSKHTKEVALPVYETPAIMGKFVT